MLISALYVEIYKAMPCHTHLRPLHYNPFELKAGHIAFTPPLSW